MFAIVDLETTGGNPGTDKIIEIAIYIHDGVEIQKAYSSLVNPEVPIPVFISRLTRITDEMVSTAPLFTDIAHEVASLLGDHIFVAHNVMFDYSFVAYALAQEGYHYENKMLCTCKTSRILLPGFPSYSLSKLCRSLSIELNNAHRAAADARATAHVLDLLIAKTGGVLDSYYTRKQKTVNRSRIPDEQLETLPGKTGVVFFYDDRHEVIYISKAANIRKKVLSVLSKMHTRKYSGLAAAATAVDYQATGSELLANIMETELVNQLQPRFNRKIRATESRFGIYEKLSDTGHLVLEKAPYQPSQSPVAIFAGEREASDRLGKILSDYQLVPSREIAKHNEELFQEPVDLYNRRATLAVETLKQGRKNFVITGRGPKADCLSMVVVRDGAYAGYAFADTAVGEPSLDHVLERITPGKDHPSIFKTIVNFVSQGKYLKIINF